MSTHIPPDGRAHGVYDVHTHMHAYTHTKNNLVN